MKDLTPVYRISQRDDLLNRRSFANLLNIADRPSSVVELFGGCGGFTAEIVDRWPGIRVLSYELDGECYKMLEKVPGNVEAIPADSLSNSKPVRDCGLVGDFNLLTIGRAQGKFKSFFERWFDGRLPKWMILTDSAPSKLHINYRSYGLSSGTLEEYMWAWDRLLQSKGYYLRSYQRSHFRTVLILAERV